MTDRPSSPAVPNLAFPERRHSRGRQTELGALGLIHLKELKATVAADVRREQLRQMVRAAPTSFASGVVIVVLAAAALAQRVSPIDLGLWVACCILLKLVRAGYCVYWHRHSSPTADPRHFAAVTTIIMVWLGLLWLVPPFLWFDQADGRGQIIITIVLVGLMSGGSAMLAAVPAAATAYTLILCAGLVRVSLFYDSWIMAALGVILTLVLCKTVLSRARLQVRNAIARNELGEQGQVISLLREFNSSGSEWLWELDADLCVRYVSDTMASSFGYTVEALIGRNVMSLLDRDERYQAMAQGVRSIVDHFERGERFHEVAFPTVDGRRWQCLSGRPIRDSDGRITGWRGVGSDITGVRLGAGTDGVKVARRDPLTGLANRLLVREMIEEARLRQIAEDGRCALLLLDLDRFKLVNDTLGHGVGDLLLVEVARRLEQVCGAHAGVGRLGGDEFAVVWRGPTDTLTLLDLSQHIADTLAHVFMIGPSAIHIGVSIGIARAPMDGETQVELMRSADLALYRAKEKGRGSFCFYEPWMLSKAKAERLLENDVRDAVRRGDLELHYQPIVNTETRETVGREALLRWWHPHRGAIGPDVFVPIIEDVGLIHQIGDWVLREACRQAASWEDGMRVAVNVSVAQLTGAGLRHTVEQALAASGLAAHRLELEVTETVFLGDDEATLAALSSLQNLGVRLVLDDFGKGYSSFGYLSRACFSKIKIDQLFVRGAAAGQRDCLAIVQSILALARGLGIETTAEGIETNPQAQMMAALGCTQLQGYLFGRPAAAEALTHAVAHQKRREDADNDLIDRRRRA